MSKVNADHPDLGCFADFIAIWGEKLLVWGALGSYN